MPVIDAYGERRATEVMRDTWGHLDAQPGVKYPGVIVFAEGIYGSDGIVTLRCEFGDAGHGPWFYEGLQDWLFQQDVEAGTVYRFDGFYRLTKRGAHTFRGKVTAVPLPA